MTPGLDVSGRCVHDNDDLECGLCASIIIDPVTLPCCGGSFCQKCMLDWLANRGEQTGIARCPGPCNAVIPFRLPPVSKMLKRLVEVVAAPELERRRVELAEEVETDSQLPGGYKPWDEVAAAMDLVCGSTLIVKALTPGVIIQKHNEERITVKFDFRADANFGCVNVTPPEIVLQLPSGCPFKIGDDVCASRDIDDRSEVGIQFGTRGVVHGRCAAIEGLVLVHFHPALGGMRRVNVRPCELVSPGPHAGGFMVGDVVESVRNLVGGQELLVRVGVRGIVIGPHTDTRVTVKFGERNINVVSQEVRKIDGNNI